jgi:hypothetical protein
MRSIVKRVAGAAGRAVAVVALAAALAAAPGAASAQETEGAALFEGRGLSEVEAGTTLVFLHLRRTEPAEPAGALDGRVEVAVREAADGRREAEVALVAGVERRVLPPMPADSAHPVLLLFLESVVASMSSATGGHPAYIRSRLREALWLEAEGAEATVTVAGAAQPGRELTVRPFADDPQREAMGGFAELELRFVLSDAVPGRIGRLEAETAAHELHPALVERMRWEGIEPEE